MECGVTSDYRPTLSSRTTTLFRTAGTGIVRGRAGRQSLWGLWFGLRHSSPLELPPECWCEPVAGTQINKRRHSEHGDGRNENPHASERVRAAKLATYRCDSPDSKNQKDEGQGCADRKRDSNDAATGWGESKLRVHIERPVSAELCSTTTVRIMANEPARRNPRGTWLL